jgi:death-on-curing protein
MQTIYFDESFAKDIHDEIIRISGGKEGVHNLGLVSSVLELIQHDLYYPSFEEKLTHLVYSINKNHAFVDGNKRSSMR